MVVEGGEWRVEISGAHYVVRLRYLCFAIFFSVILTLAACGMNGVRGDLPAIGHGGGYLSAAVYAADVEADVQQFHSSSDIAYSLLSGALDAGFVEADSLAAFAELDGFERLAVVGKVTYPYGATLVLRKGLNVRLHELDGLTIAASAPGCVLLGEFAADAERLGAELASADFIYMAFDAMLPALESGVVDAAIVKGSYSMIALNEGHSILYQNWDVEPGDECCPAIIDQAALVLLAQREKLDIVQPFIDALSAAQSLTPDELRQAVASNTMLTLEILHGQPVPEFSADDDKLLELFIEAANDHDDEDEDHD